MASGISFTKGTWEPAGLHAQGLYANDGSCNILARTSIDDADGDSKAVCAVFLQTKVKRGEAYRAKCAERDANIALISAAPDLLAALQMSLPALEWCQQQWASSPQHGEGVNVLDVVRAALTKAGAQQ